MRNVISSITINKSLLLVLCKAKIEKQIAMQIPNVKRETKDVKDNERASVDTI